MKSKHALKLVPTNRAALANTVCLDREDKAAFDRLLRSYCAEYDPEGPTETHLVEELAVCKWREYRYASFEAAIVGVHAARQDRSIDSGFDVADQSTRLALAFEDKADNGTALALLARADARLKRNYRYALRELRHLQAARKQKMPNEPTDPPENKPRAA